MKTLLAVFAVLSLAVLPSSAQEKLWTWKIQDSPGIRSIVAVAMNQDGSGAFVLADDRPDSSRSYLLVWVAARGKVLLSRSFPVEPDSYEWELAFTGPGKLLARYNHQARLFDATTGKAKLVKTLPFENAIVFGASTFGGWIDSKGASIVNPGKPAIGEPGDPNYVPAVPESVFQSADVINAWKF